MEGTKEKKTTTQKKTKKNRTTSSNDYHTHRNTIGMRAQSIIHSLLERCLSTYAYSQWEAAEGPTTAADNDGDLKVMDVLFDAVSRLVTPTTSKDIVAGNDDDDDDDDDHCS